MMMYLNYENFGLPSNTWMKMDEYLGNPYSSRRGFNSRSERLEHRNKMVKRRIKRKMAKQSRKKNR